MQVGTGSRSEKIKTYNYKDSRVSDHRSKTNFSLDGILAGQLDECIDAMTALDQREQLEVALLFIYVFPQEMSATRMHVRSQTCTEGFCDPDLVGHAHTLARVANDTASATFEGAGQRGGEVTGRWRRPGSGILAMVASAPPADQFRSGALALACILKVLPIKAGFVGL